MNKELYDDNIVGWTFKRIFPVSRVLHFLPIKLVEKIMFIGKMDEISIENCAQITDLFQYYLYFLYLPLWWFFFYPSEYAPVCRVWLIPSMPSVGHQFYHRWGWYALVGGVEGHRRCRLVIKENIRKNRSEIPKMRNFGFKQ